MQDSEVVFWRRFVEHLEGGVEESSDQRKRSRLQSSWVVSSSEAGRPRKGERRAGRSVGRAVQEGGEEGNFFYFYIY